MNIHYSPQHSGFEARMNYDPVTGEYLEPSVGVGHNPHSVFADEGEDIPTDYIDPEALAPTGSGEDMIVEGLHELYPDLGGILDYAIAQYGDEITNMYDQAIEDGDWSTVNNFLEQWSSEFREGQQPEFNREEVEQELDQLAETEPEGMEVAFELLQQAEQADNPIESEMLQMASMFHKGDVDAQSAIQAMLDKYPIDQLLPIYNKLNND